MTTMHIELNGAPHAVAERASVQELVAALNLLNQSLAVAINREVVPRAKWSERALQPHDRVDIVKAIGGG